ncbi:hypothetical protein MRB53_038180 [Persea americana]|nr:hypothetical protein MRB53_038180 [Persea americana]
MGSDATSEGPHCGVHGPIARPIDEGKRLRAFGMWCRRRCPSCRLPIASIHITVGSQEGGVCGKGLKPTYSDRSTPPRDCSRPVPPTTSLSGRVDDVSGRWLNGTREACRGEWSARSQSERGEVERRAIPPASRLPPHRHAVSLGGRLVVDGRCLVSRQRGAIGSPSGTCSTLDGDCDLGPHMPGSCLVAHHDEAPIASRRA